MWAIARGRHCISNYSNDTSWGMVVLECFSSKMYYFLYHKWHSNKKKVIFENHREARKRRVLLALCKFHCLLTNLRGQKKDCAFQFLIKPVSFWSHLDTVAQMYFHVWKFHHHYYGAAQNDLKPLLEFCFTQFLIKTFTIFILFIYWFLFIIIRKWNT